ncbi:MAG TPA: phosphatase PAP2 family protein [Bacteroidota bacterium]|nr:phosphatase PAP2 family protein [Bacteroidota bacterium]
MRDDLRPVDAITIAFLALLSLILIAFTTRDSGALTVAGINIAAGIGLFFLARTCSRAPNKLLTPIYHWYPVVAIFLVFKEVHIVQQKLGGADWDNLLIAIDHAIFGVHPTQWLQQFASPALTELLQISYASYYFIMLAAGIEVFLQHDREKFSYVLFTIVYGFFLSYLGYIIFPAVGPRFTLHDFYALDNDLPGMFLSTPIRNFLNAGESIPAGTLNAIALAQRDAFPSGHVEMTLISLYLAYHYRLKSRYVLTFFGALLIFSTVYMRYHYVIDVAGGVVFMLVTIWTAPAIVSWWKGKGKMSSDTNNRPR